VFILQFSGKQVF